MLHLFLYKLYSVKCIYNTYFSIFHLFIQLFKGFVVMLIFFKYEAKKYYSKITNKLLTLK